MPDFVGAVDQGTTSTRFMVFDHAGNERGKFQLEHEQILPRAGWVEHNPLEIMERTGTVIRSVMNQMGLSASDLAAVGVTNQRETTVVWDRRTGRPLYNAIVWQDTRTDRIASALDRDGRGDVIRRKAGLPPATYFSAGKVQWILENVDGAREAAERGDAIFGTTDTWLLWNLTGGIDGGRHVTDVTNASRTMLMNLETLDWDDELLSFFGIPRSMLPEIRPSSDPEGYGAIRTGGPLGGEIPLTGDLGDQQAAMVGQVCFAPGEAKNTYGTGNFLLLNTGTELVRSKAGLLSTVCYKFGDEPVHYALEGSIAVTGSAVQWLRDQLGIISDAAHSEHLARQVPDNGGVYFVPAFSGLFAPYWRSDARGAIVGLSRFNNSAHIARATLEAICYQSRDVAEAMEKDSGVRLDVLKVDGGVTVNELCMQMQADVLGVPVSRPVVAETTALGAAYAAGLAVGFWKSTDELRENWQEGSRWRPQWSDRQRAAGYAGWRKAVERTLDWVEVDDDVDAAVVPFPAATADAKQPARVGTAGADA
jgi:glycerol kinase